VTNCQVKEVLLRDILQAPEDLKGKKTWEKKLNTQKASAGDTVVQGAR
jgi:hypothetical protein